MGVDHLLVPREQKDEVVRLAQDAIKKLYPTISGNPDYTAIISKTSFDRIKNMVNEAVDRGAKLVQFEPELADLTAAPYCYPPTLLIDPPEDSAILQNEIFGPVLPIVSYDSIDKAIEFINRREHALALYYFGRNKVEQQRVLKNTWSGGITINEVMMHVMMSDLPGGGVGESGIGRYIGQDGFRTFSNARSVFEHGWFNINKYMRPPYGKFINKMIESGVKR